VFRDFLVRDVRGPPDHDDTPAEVIVRVDHVRLVRDHRAAAGADSLTERGVRLDPDNDLVVFHQVIDRPDGGKRMACENHAPDGHTTKKAQ